MSSADELHQKAQELSQTQNNPIEGLSIPTPAFSEEELQARYPDESPNWEEQRRGEVPRNHGYPANPMALLDSHLAAFEELDAAEQARWDKVGRTPEELAEMEEKGIELLGEEPMEGNMAMTYDELVKPMDTKQIMQARAAQGGKKKAPRYRAEVRVFVLGGHDKTNSDGDALYDDAGDKADYELLVSQVLNSEGKSMIGQKEVEGIQGTSKFKIYLEVLHLVD